MRGCKTAPKRPQNVPKNDLAIHASSGPRAKGAELGRWKAEGMPKMADFRGGEVPSG